MKPIDETGKDYGDLTVERRLASRHGKAYWHCYCNACGGHKAVSGAFLRNGDITHCGCKNTRAGQPTVASLAKRLAALESELAALRAQLLGTRQQPPSPSLADLPKTEPALLAAVQAAAQPAPEPEPEPKPEWQRLQEMAAVPPPSVSNPDALRRVPDRDFRDSVRSLDGYFSTSITERRMLDNNMIFAQKKGIRYHIERIETHLTDRLKFVPEAAHDETTQKQQAQLALYKRKLAVYPQNLEQE